MTSATAQALIHIPAGEGDYTNIMGEGMVFQLPGATSGGSVILAEVISQPGGGPPALHTHPPFEAFYILEGEYEFSGDGADGPFTVRATPGSVIYVPGGAPHNYKNVGTTVARMLAIFTESSMEGFFRDMSAATAGPNGGPPAGPPDFGKIMPILARYQVQLLGSPPPGR